MENKKLGILFIVFSLIFLLFIVYFSSGLAKKKSDLGCDTVGECKEIENLFSIINVGFGFFGFMFGLGFYILFFNKTDEKIMRRLEEEKNIKLNNEKFNIILMALDPFEKKVLKAVKEQDGITQNTLRLRVDMSKAKLSYVLQELEKRNLIKRIPKGKTLEVWLKI